MHNSTLLRSRPAGCRAYRIGGMDGSGFAKAVIFPGGFGHSDDVPVPDYDPERARQLMDDAGHRDGFNLVIHTPPARYGNDVRVSEATAQMLTAIGIRATVEVVPEAAYSSRQRDGSHSFSLASQGASSADATQIYRSFHTYVPERGLGLSNWGRYSNRDFDALVDELDATIDPDERVRVASELARLTADDLVVWSLHSPMLIWAAGAQFEVVPRVNQTTLAESVSLRSQ